MSTEQQLQAELKTASNNKDIKKMSAIITELLRPEAKLIIAEAEKNITTKDGYGVILQFLPEVKPYYREFLKALQLEGYPSDTIETIAEMYNL